MSDAPDDDPARLRRSLGTPLLALYGAGTIVGAGIYVLIGEVVGAAGYWAPLAFLIAALVAGVTGFVYAELSSRHPGAGGPVAYSSAAFGRRWLATAIGWAIVATGLVSAGTILSGFVGYLGFFLDLPRWLVIVALALTLGGIAAAGVRQSAWFMAVTTTAGVIGLVMIMIAGFGEIENAGERFGEAASLADFATISAILSASFLAFYAFIGFEDLVHMSEEAKQPTRDLPRAIVIALVVSGILYILTASAALLLLEPDGFTDAAAPLVEAIGAAGWPQWPLGILSLLVIVNGAMAQIIMATRVIYSLSRDGGVPRWLGRANRRTGTPLIATAAVTATVIVLALTVPLESLASVTSIIMLAIFFVSNIALIVLERRNPDAPFDVPNWVPWLGATLCVILVAGRFVLNTGGGG